MQRQRKIFWAKTAAIFSAIPFVLWAHEYGPDPGYCNVPKELGTCAQAGCHAGTTNDPKNSGSVTVAVPGGAYTPGTKQHLTVTISDTATSQRAWGFQLTARLASNTATTAGTFASTDANTTVMCGSANLFQQQELTSGKSQTCPSNLPLTYVEHSLTGYTASRGKTGSFSFEFDWNPPATDAGDITLYLSGNAANGDLTQNGDHIYNTSLTLKAAAANKTPVITKVINGAGFQENFEAGSWVAIQGTNLANTDPGRIWKPDTEIVGGKLPTSLDNVSVTINNKPAFVYYISPTQINVQAPSDTATGSVNVVVTNNGAASAPFAGNLQTYSPGFFPWGAGAAAPYVIATRYPDNAYISNPNVVANTFAAKPGDILILWGTGFGPTIPDIPAGTVITTPATATNPTVKIDGGNISVLGAALSYAGEYQIAVQLPDNLTNGDHDILATVGGVSSPSGSKIYVNK